MNRRGASGDASLVHAYDQQLRLTAARFTGDGAHSARVLADLFFALVDTLAPEVFAEVGAFDAAASRRVAGVHPACEVIAFEANPATHARFAADPELSAAGVDYRHLALGDRSGTVLFRQEDAGDDAVAGSSSTLPRNDAVPFRPSTPVHEVEVPTARLDDALGAAGRRICLWVDVEGATREVLSGAEQTLEDTSLLIVEVEELEFWTGQWHALDCLAFLLERGFVPVARDVEYPYQYNVVWVRPELRRTQGFVDAWERFVAAADPHPAPLPRGGLPGRISGRLARGWRSRWNDRGRDRG